METLEAKKGELRVMDLIEGDIKIEWRSDRPDEIEAARAAFDAAKKKGYLFYRMTSRGEKGEQIKEFDPSAERIVAMPAIRGG